MSIKDIQGKPEEVMQKVNDVFAFLSLPPYDEIDLEAKNTRNY